MQSQYCRRRDPTLRKSIGRPVALSASVATVALLVLGFCRCLPSHAAEGAAPTAMAVATGTDDPESPAGRGDVRVREGTELVDVGGHFFDRDSRWVFCTADGSRRLVVLENLNLERITRAITQSPQMLQWEITGTVTEYRGGNYLLVGRAILQGGTLPPEGVP